MNSQKCKRVILIYVDKKYVKPNCKNSIQMPEIQDSKKDKKLASLIYKK